MRLKLHIFNNNHLTRARVTIVISLALPAINEWNTYQFIDINFHKQ